AATAPVAGGHFVLCWDQAGLEPRERRQGAHGGPSMKTIVLGAGIVGVTSAYFLAKAGDDVTVLDRRPGVALETSFANAGLVAPGHSYTWASPRAPKILLKSLFVEAQALRLKLNADPHMWIWCLHVLRN